jgi:hypothetical protein
MNLIRKWYKNLWMQVASVRGRVLGRLSTSSETVDCVRQAYQQSPRKSTHWVSHEFSVP